MKNGYIWDLIKNDAQSVWHPSLSDIQNNTKTVPQANKNYVQHPHYKHKTL